MVQNESHYQASHVTSRGESHHFYNRRFVSLRPKLHISRACIENLSPSYMNCEIIGPLGASTPRPTGLQIWFGQLNNKTSSFTSSVRTKKDFIFLYKDEATRLVNRYYKMCFNIVLKFVNLDIKSDILNQPPGFRSWRSLTKTLIITVPFKHFFYNIISTLGKYFVFIIYVEMM